jgi:hypothetical protein
MSLPRSCPCGAGGRAARKSAPAAPNKKMGPGFLDEGTKNSLVPRGPIKYPSSRAIGAAPLAGLNSEPGDQNALPPTRPRQIPEFSRHWHGDASRQECRTAPARRRSGARAQQPCGAKARRRGPVLCRPRPPEDTWPGSNTGNRL